MGPKTVDAPALWANHGLVVETRFRRGRIPNLPSASNILISITLIGPRSVAFAFSALSALSAPLW